MEKQEREAKEARQRDERRERAKADREKAVKKVMPFLCLCDCVIDFARRVHSRRVPASGHKCMLLAKTSVFVCLWQDKEDAENKKCKAQKDEKARQAKAKIELDKQKKREKEKAKEAKAKTEREEQKKREKAANDAKSKEAKEAKEAKTSVPICPARLRSLTSLEQPPCFVPLPAPSCISHSYT